MIEENVGYKNLIKGKIPPYLNRFLKQVGRTINSYSMIKANDKLIVGISGGKDSLILALSLALRLKWLPIKYTLLPVMINWKEHPMDSEKLSAIRQYFDDLELDLKVVDEQMYSQGFSGQFNCYLCSRNRRRILFDLAKENDVHKIAIGHHLDDLVETCIINTAFRGHFETMKPVQDFFEGDIQIIRPLCQCHERTIIRLAKNFSLPVSKPVCPHEVENIRIKVKPIVESLSRIDPLAREHIFSSLADKGVL